MGLGRLVTTYTYLPYVKFRVKIRFRFSCGGGVAVWDVAHKPDLPSFTHLACKSPILLLLHAHVFYTFSISSGIFVSVTHHALL